MPAAGESAHSSRAVVRGAAWAAVDNWIQQGGGLITFIVIGSLVGLQWRMHNPTDEWGRLVLEALRELDPDKEL